MKINLKINNQDKIVEIKPHEMLLEVLRKTGCLSVKHGCDTGSCGACTVLLDGKPVLSCSYLAAKADGHSITTVEGIQDKVDQIGKYLVDEGSVQCGFCVPGLVLTVIGMEKELSNPSEQEVNHYLSGNLCRCTGYVSHIRAIMKYLEDKK